MEFKPFLHEAEIALADDFKLTLTMDYRVVVEMEEAFGKSIYELIAEILSSASVMTQFLFFMTRKHHPDLTHDVLAGIQFSKNYKQVIYAAVGNIMKRAFDLQPLKPDAPKAKAKVKASADG